MQVEEKGLHAIWRHIVYSYENYVSHQPKTLKINARHLLGIHSHPKLKIFRYLFKRSVLFVSLFVVFHDI